VLSRRIQLLLAGGVTVGALVAASQGCSIGEGQGFVRGELNVTDCWSGDFDLQPDFFGAVPYRSTLQLRIQAGGDYQTFSDGVSILFDDLAGVRTAINAAGDAGAELLVALPPEVTPPGVPIKVVPDPATVHLALYLQKSCRTQNVALYAVDAVTLINGTKYGCGATPPGALIDCKDGGAAALPDAEVAEAGALAPAAGTVGRSEMRMSHLFNGNAEEVNATERLSQGTFHVYLADPREVCPGGVGPPPPCRGYLEGEFRFIFQRGRPAQPFP
jgi:hypothetical protein